LWDRDVVAMKPQPAVSLLILKLMVVGAIAYLLVVVLLAPRQSSSSDGVQEVKAVTEASSSQGGGALAGSTRQTTDPLLIPRAGKALNVHAGPNENYAIIGQVPRDGRLDIVGRNEAGDWIAIVFTPGSRFHGWVPSAAVENVQDLRALTVVPVVPIRSR
jgi:hypothetical protein